MSVTDDAYRAGWEYGLQAEPRATRERAELVVELCEEGLAVFRALVEPALRADMERQIQAAASRFAIAYRNGVLDQYLRQVGGVSEGAPGPSAPGPSARTGVSTGGRP